MARVVAIGEVMVELSLVNAGQAMTGYAGDTFNTAVYLRRLGHEVAYATVLGTDDPFSRGLVEMMTVEGLDTRFIGRAAGRLPGIYVIERDMHGERRFHYWRSEAAVREFPAFADIHALTAAVSTTDLLYLSAITLAVVGEAGRALLGDLIDAAEAVGFDLNYRAGLWPDAATARAAVELAATRSRYISASTEDLEALDLADGPERWAAAGAEVVWRAHDHSLTILRPNAEPLRLPPGPTVPSVDTTGAGDSFNAGYLAARLDRGNPVAAVAAGRRLAELVVRSVGAVLPRDMMPPPHLPLLRQTGDELPLD